MNDMSVTIGRHTFYSKAEAIRFIQDIFFRRARNDEPLAGADADFAKALFERHPEFLARITGRKIAHFTVSTAKGGSRCFYVVDESGKMENFSFKKCL